MPCIAWGKRALALAAAAAVAGATALADVAAAQGLAGIWVQPDFSAAALARQPQRLRVLIVRETPSGMRAKLLVPTISGVPLAVEPRSSGWRLVMRMARGMETQFDVARTAEDRLSIAVPGGPQPPATLRRASAEEIGLLEASAPQKLPLPALKKLAPNGLAATPPMGFSTWNRFGPDIDDRTIREIADALVRTGLRDAGYVYVNIDDGWQGERGADGILRPNGKFPVMPALAAYLHERGLKLGLYTSPGAKSCAGFAGSYGHEAADARTFAAWGVDYLKYDWCSAGLVYDDEEMPAVYLKMAEAIRATGRPMVFSICQYGRADVWTWGADVGGNLWRTSGDIADRWDVMSAIGFAQDELAPFAGPGRWNDPDMLEVGNGRMTAAEYRAHVSLWAMLAAPLLAGHDVRHSTPETIALLGNRAVIAIDQDRLGRQGRRVERRGPVEIWTRRLADDRTAVALFNRGDAAARIEARPATLGITARVEAVDVWQERPLGVIEASLAADVEPHGVALFVLTPLPGRPQATP